MPQRAIGQIIRQRRLELGMTQEELAELASGDGEYLKQADISRIEIGQVRLPRPARLQRIAAPLGLSLGDLLMHASGVDGEGRVLAGHTSEPPAVPEGDQIWAHPGSPLDVLEGVGQAVIVCDLDGTLRYLNAYARYLFACASGEAIGRNACDVLFGGATEWREQLPEIARRLASGLRWSGSYRLRHPDGSASTLQLTLAPVLDRDGRVVAMFGTAHECDGPGPFPRD
jgi:PAS domain S-box-containing protein